MTWWGCQQGGRLKAMEMERMKQEFMEKESSLLNEIERLELANEQLIQGAPDSDLQQLQVEVLKFLVLSNNLRKFEPAGQSIQIIKISAMSIDRH